MAETTSVQEPRSIRPWYRRDPWAGRLPRPLARLERDFEHLMERFLGTEDDRGLCWPAFIPAADLLETENAFVVAIDLPGMKLDEVNVELRGGDLWISGEMKQDGEGKGKTLHLAERARGAFRRVIPLPGSVDESRIEAIYSDGVLKVTLPKSEEALPKRIPVKS